MKEGKPGLVVAIDGRSAIVLQPGGQVKKVRMHNEMWQIGEEVMVPTYRSHQWIRAISVAMPVALGGVLLLQGIVPSHQYDGVVSLDINPSINLMINRHHTVILAKGMDHAGVALLQQTSVIGTPVKRAIMRLTLAADHSGYITEKHPDILLGGVFTRPDPAWFQRLVNTEALLVSRHKWPETVTSVTADNRPLIQAMPSAVISVGRYLVWHHAKQSGSFRSAIRMSLQQLLALSPRTARHRAVPPITKRFFRHTTSQNRLTSPLPSTNIPQSMTPTNPTRTVSSSLPHHIGPVIINPIAKPVIFPPSKNSRAPSSASPSPPSINAGDPPSSSSSPSPNPPRTLPIQSPIVKSVSSAVNSLASSL